MALDLVPMMLLNVLTIFGISLGIYFAIRFFAYKRSFPLSHRFDLLWILVTLLYSFIFCSLRAPLAGRIPLKFLNWIMFLTFLIFTYDVIFILDKFFVDYFLVSLLKLYVSPPLRKVLLLSVFVLAALVGCQKIFNLNPLKVYAVPSLFLAGLGFALKDAFQTFFAGVALAKLIRIGDWIRVGDKEGEVTDINWARTVLRSWEGNYLFVPNSELQKDVFTSFNYAENRHRCRIGIGASYSAPPQKVKRVLLDCIRNIEGILPDPPPEVILLQYGDSAIQYALTFWVRDYFRYREITSEASTRIWYAFKRENLEIPFPIHTVQLAQRAPEEKLHDPETLLSRIDLFQILSQEEKHIVTEKLLKQTYLKGEVVVKEGQEGSSFYIVLRGSLEVLKQRKDGRPSQIGILRNGQFFGELSLLTGENRSATVSALEDSDLLMLEKTDFREVLERNPALADALAECVSSRQAALAEHETSQVEFETVPASDKRSGLSGKIRAFFNLPSSRQAPAA